MLGTSDLRVSPLSLIQATDSIFCWPRTAVILTLRSLTWRGSPSLTLRRDWSVGARGSGVFGGIRLLAVGGRLPPKTPDPFSFDPSLTLRVGVTLERSTIS